MIRRNSKISRLQDENQGLSNQLLMFSKRIDELQFAYNRFETQGIEMPNGYLRSTQYDYSDRNVYPFDYKSSQVDPYIQELLKEIEFLKKENKRLSSYYLDTIEQEEAARNRQTEAKRIAEMQQEKGYLSRELSSIDSCLDSLIDKHLGSSRFRGNMSKTEAVSALKKIEMIDEYIRAIKNEQVYENHNTDVCLSKNVFTKLNSPC